MSVVELPRGFGDARNFAIGGELPEADAADAEEFHVSASARTQAAAIVDPRGELRFLACTFGFEVGLKSCALLVDES